MDGKGKVAIITGASAGIGKATALTLLRALLALRAKVGVDVEGWVLRWRHEQRAQLVGDGEGRSIRRGVVGAVDRLVDEHDVGIRSEAQLAAAEAPHRDHREIERIVLGGHDLPPDGHCLVCGSLMNWEREETTGLCPSCEAQFAEVDRATLERETTR